MKNARKLLRKIIKRGGFVAEDLNRNPRIWESTSHHSASYLDLTILSYLQKEDFLRRDTCGRLLVTEKGVKFARPWFMRLW